MFMNIVKEIDKIKKLEAENNNLRRKLWLLQSRGVLPLSVFLLSGGAISLISAYIYSSTFLLLIGLGVIYTGAVIFYITPSRYIPYSILYELSLSMSRLLNNVISDTRDKRAIILHTNDINGLVYGHIFITDTTNPKLPRDVSSNNMFYDNPRGVLLPSPLYGIVTLIEKDLNTNLASTTLESMKFTLSDIFKHLLKLVDDISIEVMDNSIKIVFKGEDAIALCRAAERSTPLRGHPSCPICTSTAFIISKMMNKPIFISDNIVEDESVSTIMEVLD